MVLRNCQGSSRSLSRWWQPRVYGSRCMATLGHVNNNDQLQVLSGNEPANEPIVDYSLEENSGRLGELKRWLDEYQSHMVEVPIVIKGKRHTSDQVRYQRLPFRPQDKLARFYHASPELISQAATAALESRHTWQRVPLEERCRMFERAANLVSGSFRERLNAATMLGQAKTIKQAELDAGAELADFLRFNAHYARLLNSHQPISTADELNSTHFRPLDGFVASISPFNFTAIAGNLATAPLIMGNCVLWKPSDTAMLSNYLIMQLLQEAGFPPGVVNFVPAEGYDFGRVVTNHAHLSGLNFTGSVATYRWLLTEMGLNVRRYSSFPRSVGECGGKNFHLVHLSADLDTVVTQTIRSAFEYSGQKCSACSRLYVPASLWRGGSGLRERLVDIASNKLKLGPPTDIEGGVFTSAVIDSTAHKRILSYVEYAKSAWLSHEMRLLCGGSTLHEVEQHDQGYYVTPTIVECKSHNNKLMQEEIFGPVLAVYVYDDSQLPETLDLVANESRFGLTGSVFAQDEAFVEEAIDKLQMAAGNLYINDKSTGAVVGQQPFGGGRLSGTNDKAGGPHYLMRWCNQLTLKRTLGSRTKLN